MECDGDVTHRLIHRADPMTPEEVRAEWRALSIAWGERLLIPLSPVSEPAMSLDLSTSSRHRKLGTARDQGAAGSVHRTPHPVDESARAAVEWRA